MEESSDSELRLSGEAYPPVHRQGDVVVKEVGPWTPSVHAVLRYLESVGCPYAPRVVGSGFDALGRQTLTYIEGKFTQPGPWSPEGAAAVGRMLRELHNALADFVPPPDAVWRWRFLRELGGPRRIISQCDVAPWNIVARAGMPAALIDWDYAGPVDSLYELAQACWLNAKLHGDDVAEREGLPPLADRARQLRAIVDAYGLPAHDRRDFVDKILEVVIHDIAEQADDYDAGQLTNDSTALWAFTWRARAAVWISRHRATLQNALV